MNTHQKQVLMALILAGALFPSAPAHGQLSRLKERAKERVEQELRPRTVRSAGSSAEEEASGTEEEAAEEEAPSSAPAAASSEKAFVNFDFVPGDRVLFADDFTKDIIGDFPRRLELINGNGEVAEWRGGRFLRAADNLEFAVPLPETLPQRFTVEFDYYGSGGHSAYLYFAEGGTSGYDGDAHARAVFVASEGGVEFQGGRSSKGSVRENLENKLFPVRLMVDGNYVKMYIGGTRVANAPNFKLGRTNKIVFFIPGDSDEGTFVGNLRVSAGGRDLYEALLADGRVSTRGIYFDTGSDRIRPESAPTLEQIGTMLQEHADLKLLIEGHTDDVGADAANLALSDKRAAAVREYLVSKFRVDGSRLASQGFGESRPVAPNNTPEGRQSNRRVELVKQ